jgi:uncharacterized repeat protein (TIGR01451 family)
VLIVRAFASTHAFGGTVNHARLHRPALRRLAPTLATLAIVLAGAGGPLAAAATAATGLVVTTPFPSVVVAPGARVSFDVDLQTTTPERIDLALEGVPDGWTAAVRGGGLVVVAAETNGTDPTKVRVDVTVPAAATDGTARIVLVATAGGERRELPLEVRVTAEAGGDVTLTTDFPSLRGPASQTFNFNLTLSNQTAEDLTFAVNAQGPSGWDVTAKLTGQAQAASAIVKAGSTSGITVSATPAAGVTAGTYEIAVVATAGARQIPGTLQVEITGSYDLRLATADGRLNGSGTAGESSDIGLTVTNNGTAPISNVTLSSSPPSGWQVTFDPATVPTLAAGETANVTARVVPSGAAVAGDYVVTLTAGGDESTRSSIDVRFTVETSMAWALVGLALIAVVIVGLWWVYRRYGRR